MDQRQAACPRATYKLATGPSSSGHAQPGAGTRCPQGWEPLCRTWPVATTHACPDKGQNPGVGAPDRPPSLEEEVKGHSLQCPAQQLQEPPTLPGGLRGPHKPVRKWGKSAASAEGMGAVGGKRGKRKERRSPRQEKFTEEAAL